MREGRAPRTSPSFSLIPPVSRIPAKAWRMLNQEVLSGVRVGGSWMDDKNVRVVRFQALYPLWRLRLSIAVILDH